MHVRRLSTPPPTLWWRFLGAENIVKVLGSKVELLILRAWFHWCMDVRLVTHCSSYSHLRGSKLLLDRNELTPSCAYTTITGCQKWFSKLKIKDSNAEYACREWCPLCIRPDTQGDFVLVFMFMASVVYLANSRSIRPPSPCPSADYCPPTMSSPRTSFSAPGKSKAKNNFYAS